MSLLPSFAEFQTQALAEGFDQVLERVWEPDQSTGIHTHPFAVAALVVAGELRLDCGAQTRHLRTGDRFELAAEVPHAERYGPQGATFWVARRLAPA